MYTLPNILTIIRISLIPFFIVAFYLPLSWGPIIAAVLFALAAITDMLDGYLARKLNQTSKFGAFLDPVADKLMVAAALVVITQVYSAWWITIPAIIMIGREIVISALREWMAEMGERGQVAVNWLGKVKTIAQMVALTGMILNLSPQIEALGFVGPISLLLFYIAAALTLWSMCVYLAAAKDSLLS